MGAAIGAVIALVMMVVAVTQTSPGGAEEDLMWLVIYSVIWGLPISLLWSPLAGYLLQVPATVGYTLLLISIPLNWAVVGTVVGFVAQRLRREWPRFLRIGRRSDA